jgi:hypothetical protein
LFPLFFRRQIHQLLSATDTKWSTGTLHHLFRR